MSKINDDAEIGYFSGEEVNVTVQGVSTKYFQIEVISHQLKKIRFEILQKHFRTLYFLHSTIRTRQLLIGTQFT